MPCCTITPSPQTAAHPQATPALPAPPERPSAVTPLLTGPETFTDVCRVQTQQEGVQRRTARVFSFSTPAAPQAPVAPQPRSFPSKPTQLLLFLPPAPPTCPSASRSLPTTLRPATPRPCSPRSQTQHASSLPHGSRGPLRCARRTGLSRWARACLLLAQASVGGSV